MVFTKKNKRHRKTGMNAFDKKFSQGVFSIAGAGLLLSSMTAAYATPSSEDIGQSIPLIEPSIVEVIEPKQDEVVQIPMVPKTEENSKTEELPSIQIEKKPEPVAEVKTIKEVEKTEEIIEEAAETQENVDLFVEPVSNPKMTSPYGYRVHPVYGTGKLHAGADFGASCGTPVYASADGEVVQSGYKNGRAGNVVELSHGEIEGKETNSNYYHLSSTLVNVGDEVEQGDLIARVGTTGTSTGCHLHWGITVNGDQVDPMPFLNKD